MKPLNQKARSVLDNLIKAFDNPESLIDTLTRATLIPNNSPCLKWSLTNRFIVAMHGTGDARGYQQWKEVNRFVKKGSKAMYILVPRFKKIEDEESGKEENRLIGFMAAPVFRIEDTDGEPLPETEPPIIPKLQSVADELDIPVTYTGAVSDKVLGAYDPNDNRITLFTHDRTTFYHELSHALHKRTGKIRKLSDSSGKRDNEIVAEIGGAVLVNVFEGEQTGKQAIKYIQSYDSTKKRLLKLLQEIMEVVDLAINIQISTESPSSASEQSSDHPRPSHQQVS